MKRIATLITAAVAAVTILTSCSSENSASDARIVALTGSWTSTCFVLSGQNTIINFLFNNSNGTLTASTFDNADTTCAGATTGTFTQNFDYTLRSDITVDGSVDGITTATQLDRTDTTPNSATLGQTAYDIFAIKDLITLYIGESSTPGVNDGTTEALRPTQLAPIPFTRQ